MSGISRIERLLNLTAALLDTTRPITAEEVRERVPGYPEEKASFRRQFERDKEALRELGVPLSTVTLPLAAGTEQFGYRIERDDYELVDLGLTDDELTSLHMAARLISVEGLSGEAASWKLSPGDGGPEPFAGLSGGELSANDRVALLFSAIAEEQKVTFHYRDVQRIAVPDQLSFRNGHWYLAAFDEGRGEQRSFRVDRMSEPIATAGPFDLSDLPGPQRDPGTRPFDRPWELGTGAVEMVRVRIDAGHGDWARRHLGSDQVPEVLDNGDVEFALGVRNFDALLSFVFGFLEHAEIVAPSSVRAAFVARLVELAERAGAAGLDVPVERRS